MAALNDQARSVRSFNRFYTLKIGLLSKGHLNRPFSLTEVRVLYEIAHRQTPVAAEIGKDLGARCRLSQPPPAAPPQTRPGPPNPLRKRCRQSHPALTSKGRALSQSLDRAASREIGAVLEQVPPGDRARVVGAMGTIAMSLGSQMARPHDIVLRTRQPGDIGWVVHRHGVIYAREQGWDERFEAVVAEIAARFVRNFDLARERCWIAELNGAPVGSVFLVRESDAIARLRLLLVEPAARGCGIGKRLVNECIRFARRAGYARIVLFTESALKAAQHIYEKAGFHLVEEKEHSEFGVPVLGQTWELEL